MAPKVSAHSNQCGPKPAGAGPHVRPATAKKQARTAAATIASIILSPAAALAEDAATAYERMTGTAASVVPAAAAASSTDLPSITDDPLLLAGVAAAVAIPVIAAVAVGSSAGPKIQATSALKAFELLGDTGAVLLDVRSKAAVKEEGVPDLRPIKRKAVVIPFSKVNRKGEVLIDEEAFSAQLARSSLIKEDNVVIVLDSDGSEAGTVAKLLAEAKPEVSRILTVQRGTEAWKAADLPWREPSKGMDFNLDLTKLNLAAMADRVDVIAEQYQRNPSVANGLLAAGVIAGASVLLVTEIETVLEVVGVVAAGQFLVRQMLFADNREQLAQDLRALFKEKIAAGEAADDFKRLAAAILDTEEVEEGATEPPAAAPVAAPVAAAKPAEVADAPGTSAASEAVPEPAEVKPEDNAAKGEAGNTNPTEAEAAVEPAEEAKLAEKPTEAEPEAQPAEVVASGKLTEVSHKPAGPHAPRTATAVSVQI